MPQELNTFFRTISENDIIFLSVAAGIWMLVFYHNLQFYYRLAFYRTPPSGAVSLPVTIIMVERNEENNLKKNLPGWLDLGYPEYEVLVVDDFSEDNSLTTVGILKQKTNKLKFTGLSQETRYSEKLSRNLALKAAGFENLVFVHPSMETPDNHWLPGIATALSGQKSIAIGYTRLKSRKGFYHLIYRIESFFQQIQSMSHSLNGLPFVTSEENIAFKKQVYFGMNGFAGKIGEEYLNMELIFNQAIRRKNNSVMFDGNLALQKDIPVERGDYLNLLHRFLILKKSLRWRIRMISGFFNLLKILFFPVLLVCVILFPEIWPEIAILFFLHVLLRIIVIKRLQNRLFEKGIFLLSLVYGMLIPYFKIFTGWKFYYKRKNS
jgi:glycosyltransferase involved in cell wall biosynthesis